jgi:pseudo-rSAM protein
LANLNYKEIIVNFPININIFQNVLENVEAQTTLHFIIENMKQYEQVGELLLKHGEIEYQIEPFFNDNNYNFFKESIFLNKEDIFTTTHSFRQIFAHQKLNTHSFGSLTVLANGDVHANVNSDKLGNVETDSILDLIDKEMTANTAWRQIRDKVPCTNCLYQYLCPSPSNYEKAIGKPDLCHVLELNN